MSGSNSVRGPHQPGKQQQGELALTGAVVRDPPGVIDAMGSHYERPDDWASVPARTLIGLSGVRRGEPARADCPPHAGG